MLPAKLAKIDIATGAATPAPAGPGVKLAPSVLPSGAVAYLRRDKAAHGVFYADGSKGPAGKDIRFPSWSPDGKQVVYSRFSTKHPIAPVRLWSRDPNFDLYSTAWLPAYDPTGAYLAITRPNPDDSMASTRILLGRRTANGSCSQARAKDSRTRRSIQPARNRTARFS